MSKRNLWKVSVYCLAAGWVCSQFVIYLGGFIFLEKVVGDDGVIRASIDPVRSGIFHGTLFLAVLLVGGIWFRRFMSRREIAVSALMASGLYLLLELLLSCIPGFPSSLAILFVYFLEWKSTIAVLVMKLTNNQVISAVVSSFAPLLFILFGKKAKA